MSQAQAVDTAVMRKHDKCEKTTVGKLAFLLQFDQTNLTQGPLSFSELSIELMAFVSGWSLLS